MSERQCKRCGMAIPASAHGRRRYCSNKCRTRHFEERGAPCKCGRRKMPHSQECRTCWLERRKAAQTARFDSVKQMWDEGLSTKEIASAMDSTPGAVGVLLNRMRRAGWDVPLRRVDGYQPVATKAQCRQQLGNAIANSQVRRSKRCEECGKLAFVEAHHEDYSRPFYVTWLCQPCHVVQHGRKSHAREVVAA